MSRICTCGSHESKKMGKMKMLHMDVISKSHHLESQQNTQLASREQRQRGLTSAYIHTKAGVADLKGGFEIVM